MRQKIISLNTPIARSASESLYPWQWDGLVGSWAAIEGGGQKAFDWIGNGHHGTFGTTTAAPSWSHGLAGSALSFGGNDYVDAGDIEAADGVDRLTVSAWAYKTSTRTEFIVSKRIQGSDDSWGLAYGNNLNPVFEIFIGGVRKSVYTVPDGSPNDLSLNKWYHIAGTYDGSALRIYVDGVLRNTTSGLSGNIDETVDAVRLGWGYSNLLAFTGLLDDTRIYSRVWSPQELSDESRLGPKSLLIRKPMPRVFVMSGNRRRRLLLGACA